jgi:ribosomal protein S27E
MITFLFIILGLCVIAYGGFGIVRDFLNERVARRQASIAASRQRMKESATAQRKARKTSVPPVPPVPPAPSVPPVPPVPPVPDLSDVFADFEDLFEKTAYYGGVKLRAGLRTGNVGRKKSGKYWDISCNACSQVNRVKHAPGKMVACGKCGFTLLQWKENPITIK